MVFDVGEEDGLGLSYIAMEFVPGQPLDRVLVEQRQLDFAQVRAIGAQVADALAAAHEAGIIHRDIKPGNMMIDRKNTLKIMDFGLVRLAAAGHSLTMSGTVMGTVSYFSPEQGRGEPCDQRTDLYALGVVFYELLTGKLPFVGENATSVIYQHIHAEPKAPCVIDPHIPPDYQAVVFKCMQKQADARYMTAVDLLSDLERLAAGHPPAIALERPDLLSLGATMVAGSYDGGASAGAPPKRSGLLVGIAAGVVAVIGTSWYLLARPDGQAANPTAHSSVMPNVASSQSPSPVLLPAPVDQAALGGIQKLETLLGSMAKQQNQDVARTQSLSKAGGLVAERKFAAAEGLLSELLAAAPDDDQLKAALQQVQVAREQAERQTQAFTERMAAGEAALAKGDLPVAREMFLAASRIDSLDPGPTAKLADVARREAEAVAIVQKPVQSEKPVVTPQPVADPAHQGDAALASAGAALAHGDLPEARRIINVNRGINVGDQRWADIAKKLDTAEGKSALREAQAAFERGAIDLAGKAAASAQALIADDPELKALLVKIAKVEDDSKQQRRIILEADNQLADEHPDIAVKMLSELAAKHPEDATIANALRRAKSELSKAQDRAARVEEQLTQADERLSKHDLDSARQSYLAALQFDQKNVRAKAGLETVDRRKREIEDLCKHFATALQGAHIAEAKADLVKLRELAPGSPQVIIAEQQMENALLKEADARQKAEALELSRQAHAKTLDGMLDDLARPVPELDKLMADFKTQNGADRAELPGLERKLEDRRSRAAILAGLGELDAAFAAKDRAGLAKHVTDAEWLQAVSELSQMPSATMTQQLELFTRTGDTVIASIAIKTSLPEAPEEVLHARYEYTRSDTAWRITSAHLQKP
ncbi:MAG: protein kinase [Planctomycetota bacterium]